MSTRLTVSVRGSLATAHLPAAHSLVAAVTAQTGVRVGLLPPPSTTTRLMQELGALAAAGRAAASAMASRPEEATALTKAASRLTAHLGRHGEDLHTIGVAAGSHTLHAKVVASMHTGLEEAINATRAALRAWVLAAADAQATWMETQTKAPGFLGRHLPTSREGVLPPPESILHRLGCPAPGAPEGARPVLVHLGAYPDAGMALAAAPQAGGLRASLPPDRDWLVVWVDAGGGLPPPDPRVEQAMVALCAAAAATSRVTVEVDAALGTGRWKAAVGGRSTAAMARAVQGVANAAHIQEAIRNKRGSQPARDFMASLFGVQVHPTEPSLTVLPRAMTSAMVPTDTLVDEGSVRLAVEAGGGGASGDLDAMLRQVVDVERLWVTEGADDYLGKLIPLASREGAVLRGGDAVLHAHLTAEAAEALLGHAERATADVEAVVLSVMQGARAGMAGLGVSAHGADFMAGVSSLRERYGGVARASVTAAALRSTLPRHSFHAVSDAVFALVRGGVIGEDAVAAIAGISRWSLCRAQTTLFLAWWRSRVRATGVSTPATLATLDYLASYGLPFKDIQANLPGGAAPFTKLGAETARYLDAAVQAAASSAEGNTAAGKSCAVIREVTQRALMRHWALQVVGAASNLAPPENPASHAEARLTGIHRLLKVAIFLFGWDRVDAAAFLDGVLGRPVDKGGDAGGDKGGDAMRAHQRAAIAARQHLEATELLAEAAHANLARVITSYAPPTPKTQLTAAGIDADIQGAESDAREAVEARHAFEAAMAEATDQVADAQAKVEAARAGLVAAERHLTSNRALGDLMGAVVVGREREVTPEAPPAPVAGEPALDVE